MPDAAHARKRMVKAQLVARGICDCRVLEAMGAVHREAFVSPGLIEFAYEDSPLAIPAGQTISQPYVVAFMLEAAALHPEDRVLEIGTGSGYAAAVASRLCKQVVTIERHRELAEAAQEHLKRQRYDNVTALLGDGTKGWLDKAPYDAILVAAGGPEVPETLKHQLAIGGRLVMPVGMRDHQRLVKLTRRSERHFEKERLLSVRFVPLIGEEGWTDCAPGQPAASVLHQPQR